MNAFVTALGIATGPLLARALGPSGRGALAAIVVPLTFAPSFLDFGISSYAIRLSARQRSLGPLVASLGVLSLAGGAIGLVIAAPLASALAGSRPVVHTYLLVGLLLLPITLIGNLFQGFLVGRERWRVVMVVRTTPFLVAGIAVTALFAIGRLTVATAAAATIVSGALAVAPTFSCLRGIDRLVVQRKLMHEAVRFGSRAWLASFGSIANARVDQLLMVPLVPSHELGIYVVAVSFAGLIGIVTSALSSGLQPRVAQGDRGLPARATRVTFALTATSSVGLALVGPWLIPLLFGSDFANAVPLAWILLLAMVPTQMSSVLASMLTAAGFPGTAAKSEFIALASALPVLVVLLPIIGAFAAALAAVLSTTIRLVYLVAIARRRFDQSARAFLVLSSGDITLLHRLVKKS